MNRYLCLVLLVVLGACDRSEPNAVKEVPPRVTRVVIETPQLRDIEYVLTALGSVESIYDPTVSAETSGQVHQIAVREGDTVKADQLLAALDSTLHAIESAKAEAEVRRNSVLVDNQRNEVQRLQRLDESQSVSRDKLEDEQAQLKILAAQRDVANKQWERHRYLESKTRITAPLDGMVTRRYISPGDYVSAGLPLFEMVSIDRLRARIAFPEHDASRISIGMPVKLTTPAAPGEIAVGQVAAVNPQIKMHNRAVEITVEFDNPGGWLPGASTDAMLVVEQHQQALTVSQLAMVTRGGREVVFVVNEGQATAVPVESGWRENGWVELVSGVSAADRIVVEGAGLLSDGSQVEVESSPP